MIELTSLVEQERDRLSDQRTSIKVPVSEKAYQFSIPQ